MTRTNPAIYQRFVGTGARIAQTESGVEFGESIPYDGGEFDVVFADNVFEHLPNPEKVFAEAACFSRKRPTNCTTLHTIARITSHGFHHWVNRLRGRAAENTFPTRYLANTPADVHRLAAKTGFDVQAIDLIEGRPEYLRFSALTYLGGWMYERLVNTIPLLDKFRILLVAELRKP